MPSITFTVTNDLCYDQRMMRICSSLGQAGYNVTLVGRKMKDSVTLTPAIYKQKRLNCFFQKGKLFYLEFNLRLFLYLLFKKTDAICSIDLDTIVACYYISKIKGIKRIYDAHEYFSQQKEIITRPAIYKVWHWIEKTYLPKFPNGYTVGNFIATEFNKNFGVHYEVIRNLPLMKEENRTGQSNEDKKIIIYQGAVNEARGLEFLIPAMKSIDALLHIYGDGNFVEQTRLIISTNNLADKVFMKGKLLPEQLDAMTTRAYIGLNLVENIGLNQYYSLANKFFDLIHHNIPQVTMNFPEYKKINDVFEVAVLIDNLQVNTIENAIRLLLTNENLYLQLKQNCGKAKKILNWQEEEKKLFTFYKNIIG